MLAVHDHCNVMPLIHGQAVGFVFAGLIEEAELHCLAFTAILIKIHIHAVHSTFAHRVWGEAEPGGAVSVGHGEQALGVGGGGVSLR